MSEDEVQKPKKRRPRIGEQQPSTSQSSLPRDEAVKSHRPRIGGGRSDSSQNSFSERGSGQGYRREYGQRTDSRRISTTSDSRRGISPYTSLSQKEKLERLLDDPSRLSDKDKVSILSKFVKNYEKKDLVAGNFSSLIRKYKSAIRRQYVCLAAREDVNNYCSAMPKKIDGRAADVRLETMEQLLKKVENGELDPKKFAEIHKKYFPDIISKDSLPDAQVTKMLRCMAAGKFYAPKDKNGNFDERALSSVYQEARRRKPNGKKYSPGDYDLFGVNSKGEPLSPVFDAVNGSANFRKMKNVIVAKMSEMGISPEEAYQLNAADIAHLLQPVKGEVRDIPFSDVTVGIVDSPYQEFSEKLGLLLKMGGASRLGQKEQEKIWLNHFASKAEKESFNEYGDRSSLNVFLSYSERIYEKLKTDFKENDISDGFIDAWADSLCRNKSPNPKLVKGFPKVPFKIDIHHWERLSAAGNDAVAADKNNPDNFGVMIQYSESDVDIHAEKHRGESAHFVTSDFMERQDKFPQKHIICTSSHLVVSCPPEYFSGRVDKTEVSEKLEQVRAKKESLSQDTEKKQKTERKTPAQVSTEQVASIVKGQKDPERA